MSGPAATGRAPGWPRQAAKIALALALGTLGGYLADRLALPLAWMIGAMAVTTVAAVAGLPITMAMNLRTVMVAVLGIMLGSGFSPEILERLGQWSLSLAAVGLYAAVAGAACTFYYRRLCRYDPVTAYFAAMPGGLSEMVLMGSAMGGDMRIISLTHAARVLLVVMALPFAFQLLAGYEPGDKPAAGLPLLDMDPGAMAVLALCGLFGFLGARALRIPAAGLVGPMFLSAVVHLIGWSEASPPLELVAAAQVVIGSAIGCRFAGTAPALIGRVVLTAAGGTAILLAVSLATAFALQALTEIPGQALVLAFAPGGLAEMSLIALALSVDAAFVATHHVIRIFLIVIFAPLAFRLLRRRRNDPD